MGSCEGVCVGAAVGSCEGVRVGAVEGLFEGVCVGAVTGRLVSALGATLPPERATKPRRKSSEKSRREPITMRNTAISTTYAALRQTDRVSL